MCSTARPARSWRVSIRNEVARYFPSTDLADIGDELADGIELDEPDSPSRCRCSTGCGPISAWRGWRITPARGPRISSASSCSPTITAMSTNSSTGRASSSARTAIHELAGAGGLRCPNGPTTPARNCPTPPGGSHQMPAYHLVGEGRGGITLVNIGVGPSNAKTICDHLAVLRPEAWLMIGHCGGLRASQKIGDYVLAHAYLRDDHVLDPVLPPEIPLPAIAEVQQALAGAAEQVRASTARPQAAHAHRHRRHHRRSQLGAALHQLGTRCRSAARSASTWKAPPSPRRAIASASPTARCCASATSRCTARSSCRARRTTSTKKRSPPTCRSA